MTYKIKKLGTTKNGSIQYAVFDSLNMIVAIYFQDAETQSKYRIHLIDDCYSSIKDILEVINNA